MKHRFDYVVYLQKPDTRTYNRITRFLLIIAIALFLFLILNDKAKWFLYTTSAVVIIAQLVYNFYKEKKGRKLAHSVSFAVCVIGLFHLPGTSFLLFILSILYGIAGFLEHQTKLQQWIGFNETGIYIYNLWKKYYPWNDINNIILKDGLLTVDYKNNKIFQKETDIEGHGILEEEFNEFYRSKLREQNSAISGNQHL